MLKKKQTKFIFVTGGVLSGIGKGIFAASVGNIMKNRGFSVNIQKLDPYLNFDAGTLNPGEHGEVFVTDDGAETDLDLGHYERFIDQNLTRSSSVMSGQIYSAVFDDERKGKYLGKTVQVIPHLTNKIQEFVLGASKGFDIHLAEVGGTIGDMEAVHFIEAIRQLKRKVGEENVMYAHLVYVPYLEASREMKTKPAQSSVRDLLALGIHPDILGVRHDRAIEKNHLRKIALSADVKQEAVVPLPFVKKVYDVPANLEKAGLGDYICKTLGLKSAKPKSNGWEKMQRNIKESKETIKVGLIAKYLSNEDTYKSVTEALKAAFWANKKKVKIIWIDSEEIEQKGTKLLEGLCGIVIPGGFGNRGTEGKILAAKYARENNIPYLGLCLGMQIAVIEFARNVLAQPSATSGEFDPKSKKQVIHIMPEQRKNMAEANYGATMRLGAYPCVLDKKSRSYKLYGKDKISERHRHRYEFNNDYREEFVEAGMLLAGLSPDHHLVEIVEIPDHKYYVASQFHPEFKSRPDKPHPLFIGFAKACLEE
ncbi:CTP synthase [candidate division WS5 bacterium]|uniref:CTP synthase n=1 Tax=candidate division WS5 bacterium TaxID=2093353 RepID=A0A419DAZ6_9BACT|nr:MAG: CTP synthase [candidate division WS5 bacterium]